MYNIHILMHMDTHTLNACTHAHIHTFCEYVHVNEYLHIQGRNRSFYMYQAQGIPVICCLLFAILLFCHFTLVTNILLICCYSCFTILPLEFQNVINIFLQTHKN